MGGSQPRVGVVTVTYNSEPVLRDFLDSVSAQEGVDVRLYAIDNLSSDASVAMLEAEHRIPGLVVVANDDNMGVAVGNNQGIQRALDDGCDWIFLLNNDTLFGPTTILELVNDAEVNDLDLVSPVIEATTPPDTVWYSGGHFTPTQGFRTFHDHAGEPTSMFPNSRIATGYASTCALLIRPEVFFKVGLMDPVYFVYFDDVDFAVRCVAEGYRYWVTPAAHVVHKASSLTGGKASAFTIKWYSRNWPLIALRHLPPVQAARALAVIQVWMFARLLSGKDSASQFLVRQRSFGDGVKAARSRPAPRARSAGA